MNLLQCHACGKTFRSMSAEAKHRHNFPAYCNKKSKMWKTFQKEINTCPARPATTIATKAVAARRGIDDR